ncbi:hypothetical protein GW17_00026633 [Ensete ventricosum]|nr:hypothetical protein GW17_00026633 [Ensete ventricosum]
MKRLSCSRLEPRCADPLDAVEDSQHLALEGGSPMSQGRLTPVNPIEDAPPTTQPTSGGAYRPPLPLHSFGDGNIPSHTQGRYWSLLNDPRLTPPPPNPRTPMVTLEAFQGLTNQVQAIARMLQAIIPYIPQLTQQ